MYTCIHTYTAGEQGDELRVDMPMEPIGANVLEHNMWFKTSNIVNYIYLSIYITRSLSSLSMCVCVYAPVCADLVLEQDLVKQVKDRDAYTGEQRDELRVDGQRELIGANVVLLDTQFKLASKCYMYNCI